MKAPKRKYGWLWGGGLLFAAGYITVVIAQKLGYAPQAPVIFGPAVAVALTIPFAARARRLLSGGGWGLWLGLAASLGICAAMVPPAAPVLPRAPELELAVSTVATAQCCAAVGPAWGVALAAPISIGFCAVPFRPVRTISPELLQVDVLVTTTSTAIPTTLVGAVFALLAERRRKRLAGDDDEE